MSPFLPAAVLAAEDHRFFEHSGLDVVAVGRALVTNTVRGEIAQGASTLTQQLAKNLALGPERTWRRKILEGALALALERRYEKEKILEAYLNTVYLGQRGRAALVGVGAAAQSYWDKDARRLGLAESALLAGIIRAPNRYSPDQHPERAQQRRDAVLRRMHELGIIDAKTLAQALAQRTEVRAGTSLPSPAPYFLDYVRATAGTNLARGNPRIYTTLDPSLQRAAEAAVARGLDRLESTRKSLRRSASGQRLQAALVALDPATGEIRALVGGRDYELSAFNRVTHAHRQPGSAFKPFVFLAALRRGAAGQPPTVTPASLVEDMPIEVATAEEPWTPRNFEDRFDGTITVRQALERSSNAAAVRLAQAAGLDGVVKTAREVGFTSRMTPVPALALGSFEVTPLELAGAYATLANGGARTPVRGVRMVEGRPGAPRTETRTGRGPASTLSPDEAYLVTNLLEGVVDRGTGAGVRALGLTGAVAGKTGTTNDARDAWFAGVLAPAGRGGLGGVRRRHAPRTLRRERRAADLDRLHAGGRHGRGSRRVHGAACGRRPPTLRQRDRRGVPRGHRPGRGVRSRGAAVDRGYDRSTGPRHRHGHRGCQPTGRRLPQGYRPRRPPGCWRRRRRASAEEALRPEHDCGRSLSWGPGGDRPAGAASQAGPRARERWAATC